MSNAQLQITPGPIASALLSRLAENWWLLLLRGLAAIAFGLIAFFWPGITLLSLTYVWGAYTLIDGVKYPWEAGDLLNLPCRRHGIIVQHFNTDPQNWAKFLVAEHNWFACLGVDRGCGFEQLEDSPDYRPRENGAK